MRFLRSTLFFILPLLSGIAALFALPFLGPLVQFEHSFFVYPERFQADTIFSDARNPESFIITAAKFESSYEPSSIASYLVDEETRDILGSQDLTPTQWAYFLNHISKGEKGLIVIASPLSWPNAEEIPLRTLEHEVSQTQNLVIGLKAEFNEDKSPLPAHLESSVITREINTPLKLPEIDKIVPVPSINAPLFGISSIRGPLSEKWLEEGKVPMLVRWGKNILPTTHLASLIAAHQLKPSQVIIEPSGYLRLGESGSIIKINDEGMAIFPKGKQAAQSASFILTTPDQTASSKILLSPDSSEFDQLLSSHIPHALSQKPTSFKTYRRWSIFIEIAFLIALTLLLQTRKSWFFLLGIIVLINISVTLSHWFLLLPVLTLALTFALLPKPLTKTKKTKISTPEEPQKGKQTSPTKKAAEKSPATKAAPKKKTDKKAAKKAAKKSARRKTKRRRGKKKR